MQVLILVFSFQLSKYTIWDADPLCIGTKYLNPNYQRFVSQAAKNVFYQLHRRQKCFLPSPQKYLLAFPIQVPSVDFIMDICERWLLVFSLFTMFFYSFCLIHKRMVRTKSHGKSIYWSWKILWNFQECDICLDHLSRTWVWSTQAYPKPRNKTSLASSRRNPPTVL